MNHDDDDGDIRGKVIEFVGQFPNGDVFMVPEVQAGVLGIAGVDRFSAVSGDINEEAVSLREGAGGFAEPDFEVFSRGLAGDLGDKIRPVALEEMFFLAKNLGKKFEGTGFGGRFGEILKITGGLVAVSEVNRVVEPGGKGGIEDAGKVLDVFFEGVLVSRRIVAAADGEHDIARPEGGGEGDDHEESEN